MVGAEPFIRNMKDGYQADVGEGGNRLSTGQKQLISFARAILTNPSIFVLTRPRPRLIRRRNS